jgi:hypothetical protein
MPGTRTRLTMIAALTFMWLAALPVRAAQDAAHAVTGIVKHVDHGTKKLVVEMKDGTEHTIKYTDRTLVKAGKESEKGAADTWLATKDGARVTVHYTEKAGDKTAVAIKDAAEKTGDALK